MRELLTVWLDGDLGRAELDLFRKLLDLRPKGRLDDDFDEEFGNRPLTSYADGDTRLTLWREPWHVALTSRAADPPAGLAERIQGEVLAVAAAVGLRVARTEPDRVVPAADWAAEPTERRALTVRFSESLSVDRRELVGRILHLRREGMGGDGRGWRYVRRDPGGKVLLQLLERWPDFAELVLLYNREPPDPATIEACHLQITAAADKAALTITESTLPLPAELDWERLGTPAAGAQNLDDLWTRLDLPPTTPNEVRRSRLIATIMSSAWHDAPALLRGQARDFLIGLPPTDRAPALGLIDQWLR